MAYLCITELCRGGHCASCPGHENRPPPNLQIMGGGICVHPCHGEVVNPKLAAEVEAGYAARENDDKDA